MGSDPNISCSTAAFHCCWMIFEFLAGFFTDARSLWIIVAEPSEHNDLWLPNDHYWALFSCSYFSLDWGQQTAETLYNFYFYFLILDRSDFLHPHTISCQPATTTSWSSPIFKATSQCPCHRSSSLSTPTKSSRDAGIHQISHSCQLPQIKLQNCGRCHQFKRMNSVHIFSRSEIIIFLSKFVENESHNFFAKHQL